MEIQKGNIRRTLLIFFFLPFYNLFIIKIFFLNNKKNNKMENIKDLGRPIDYSCPMKFRVVLRGYLRYT